jgi:hypothetical protein
VYEPKDKATVFIGSSRIKYDIDIATWEDMTGDKAIQLADVGSSPLPALYNLADDEDFKGKLVIDVTEFLFFNKAPFVYKTPAENIAYYKKETPSQKFGFLISEALESKFAFIDKEEYSLNGLLTSIKVKNRENVYEFPDFPAGFTPVTLERQSFMTDELVNNPNQIKQVTAVWGMLGEMMSKEPPITDAAVDSIISSVKQATDKIKARGGEVIFTRTPSSGPLLAMEKAGFPRERFWNKILAATQCEGIHFEDFPALANFQCPEDSHLSVSQAREYTAALIHILQAKGWKFPKK